MIGLMSFGQTRPKRRWCPQCRAAPHTSAQHGGGRTIIWAICPDLCSPKYSGVKREAVRPTAKARTGSSTGQRSKHSSRSLTEELNRAAVRVQTSTWLRCCVWTSGVAKVPQRRRQRPKKSHRKSPLHFLLLTDAVLSYGAVSFAQDCRG